MDSGFLFPCTNIMTYHDGFPFRQCQSIVLDCEIEDNIFFIVLDWYIYLCIKQTKS